MRVAQVCGEGVGVGMGVGSTLATLGHGAGTCWKVHAFQHAIPCPTHAALGCPRPDAPALLHNPMS